MEYLVLSRKYRPRSFDEVVGQSHITGTLQKAVETGRVAQAYIFSGTRGTGKTTLARILAKALNCVHGPTPTPCNSCEICNSVDSGDDVDVIEIDGASNNSVDDVRNLRANASYTPARARYKIYYIDEVHMLSASAFNALLKTLEEPPAHVKFILATTEPHKIPPTIQSRCQRFDFRNIPADEILRRLRWMCEKEAIEVGDGALEVIARFASGSMRDGESILDQMVSSGADRITQGVVNDILGVVPADAFSELLRALSAADTAAALEAVDRILCGGTPPRQFVSELIDYLRDCLVSKCCGQDTRLIIRSAAERKMLAADAAAWTEEALIYAMQLCSETHARMVRSPQSRGLLDVAVVKLSRVKDYELLRQFVASLREGQLEAPPKKEAEDPPPPEAAIGASPERVRGLTEAAWTAICGAVKAKGPLVARTLQQHASVALEGETLGVVLPGNFGVHKAAFEKPELRDAIEAAASQALGRSVRLQVSCQAANGSQAAPEQTGAARKRSLKQAALADPAVRKVLEAFDASIVEADEPSAH